MLRHNTNMNNMNTDTKEGDVVKPVDHTPEAVAGEVTAEQAGQLFDVNKNHLHNLLNESIKDSIPYLDVMDRGTYPEEPAAMLTTPANGTGNTDCIDGNLYVYQAKPRVIKSRPVNLSGIYPLKGSIITEFQSVKHAVNELLHTSARTELYLRSGVKAVVRDGVVPVHMITGGINQIDVAMPSVKSDAPLTAGLVEKFAAYMRDVLLVKPFRSGNGQSLRLIAGWGTLTGVGRTAGIEFFHDVAPMRSNFVDGQYVFINPEVVVQGEYGPVSRPNPEWLDAEFEVALLCGCGAFSREVPATLKDNNGIQLTFDTKEKKIVTTIHQAFRPLYPWFVMPIMHKRRK